MHYLLIFIALLLTSCEKEIKTVTKSTDQISKTLQEYVNDPNKSVEELEKLHQVEYEVFSLPPDSSNTKYKNTLNEMGKKRWDCFHVENIRSINEEGKVQANLMFFCKRTPETLLRYVPRTLIGR